MRVGGLLTYIFDLYIQRTKLDWGSYTLYLAAFYLKPTRGFCYMLSQISAWINSRHNTIANYYINHFRAATILYENFKSICRTLQNSKNIWKQFHEKKIYLDCGSGGLKDEAAYEAYKFKHLTNRQDFKIKVSCMGMKGTMVDHHTLKTESHCMDFKTLWDTS